MTVYDLIFEELQNRVDSGELTVEQAEEVNELAYDRYVDEATRLSKEQTKKVNASNKKFFELDDKIEKYNNILANTPSDAVRQSIKEKIERLKNERDRVGLNATALQVGRQVSQYNAKKHATLHPGKCSRVDILYKNPNPRGKNYRDDAYPVYMKNEMKERFGIDNSPSKLEKKPSGLYKK